MTDDITYTVRTRVSAPDPFNGLRGREYYQMRGLKPRPNHSINACEHCELMKKWPNVQRLLRRTAVRIGRERQREQVKPRWQQLWRIA